MAFHYKRSLDNLDFFTFSASLNSISMLKQEAEEKEDEMKCCQKKLKSIEKQLKQSEKMKVDLNHKVT